MTSDRSLEEQTPLLQHPRSKTSQSLISRWNRHLKEDVSRQRADLVLILCYLITGLLDSASISVWGSFVSMQTGQPTNPLYFLPRTQ